MLRDYFCFWPDLTHKDLLLNFVIAFFSQHFQEHVCTDFSYRLGTFLFCYLIFTSILLFDATGNEEEQLKINWSISVSKITGAVESNSWTFFEKIFYLPGVMMMLLASLIISMVWSRLTSVWVPTISMGLPPSEEVVPYPPRITLGRERFIALEEKMSQNSTGWRNTVVRSKPWSSFGRWWLYWPHT